MIFADLVAAAQARSTLAIGLAPSIKTLPLVMQRFDEPFLPFGKAVIDATADLTCAYVFHLAAYLALGAAGAVALERTIAYVPANVVKILHGPFASTDYVQAASEEAFGVQAVTLIATADPATIAAYARRPEYGVFVESNRPPGQDQTEQVGTYRSVEPGHNLLSLLHTSVMHWYWQDAIYTSVGDDFRDALHEAARSLAHKKSQNAGLT
jgi:orotidine-5'-phosphate decarboxylase